MSFALIDCNNFYVSCERVFNPRLSCKPVVALSNNDGCVISRSAEAKALEVPMGAPYFKIEQEFRRQGGIALSSNYALYADMSNRVMSLLGTFSPHQEIYSIDECFLGMEGFQNLTAIGRTIRQHILKWTGLPVCVGFGPTKTLAKLANHVAKKQLAWQGVCDLDSLSPIDQQALIGPLAVGEVWGVGRKYQEQLAAMNIHTVRELKESDPRRIRQRFSVVLEKTVMELRGVPCIDLEEVAPDKQQIMCSRSFGTPVHDLENLRQALASFVARACEKLRAQGSRAGSLLVFIQTSPFRLDDPQYTGSLRIPLSVPTDDTLAMTRYALAGLEKVYRPGFPYAKAGVMLGELVSKDREQFDLFGTVPEQSTRNDALMSVLDAVNRKFGRKALGSAAALTEGHWRMKQQHRSPAYTTQWGEILRLS